MLEPATLFGVFPPAGPFVPLVEKPALPRDRLDMLPEVDEDEMARTRRGIREAVRLQPGDEVGVGAREGALIPRDVHWQLVRVQQCGPEDVLVNVRPARGGASRCKMHFSKAQAILGNGGGSSAGVARTHCRRTHSHRHRVR